MTTDAPPPASSRRDDLAALRLERGERPARKRRRWPWLAGAVVALALVALWLRPLLEPPAEVRVVEARAIAAEEAPRAEVLAGSGYVVTGDRYVSIGASVAGRIERYFVEEGQAVETGEILVQLDDREHRATIARLEASLRAAEASHALARAELRRGLRLFEEGVLSIQERESLESRERVAAAAIDELEAEITLARVRLEHTTLRAPAAGIVLAKLKEVGEIAVPGGFAGSGDLVRLANLGDLRAEVDVNEADLERIRLGQAAHVTPDAYPERRYAAEVVKLYPQVDRQKGTLRVEMRIREPDARLLPDMSVRVRFLGERGDDATIVLVPTSAVARDADGAAEVWRLDRGVAQRLAVVLDGTAGDETRVVRGLAGGERIVATTSRPLREGERPKVVRGASD
jgi:RND family efflux transporter MFP subunit